MTDRETGGDSQHEGAGPGARLGGSSANSSIQDLLSRMRDYLGDRPPREDLPGGTIGRFAILRELGRGSFGVVLLVHDPSLDCERALKVPTEAALSHEAARRRFVKEAKFTASIDHPNVVRVVEADDLGGLCYLVMEFCPEGSLSSWMRARPKDRPIPEKWAARLVAQIAEGVHQAHVKGILHRDLKPANVLLVRVGADDGSDPPDLSPKVADFGLAKLLDGDGEGMSVDGTPVGTYAYMSPEQARGSLAKIGPSSDVYGLGAILFELLAGSRAYPQGSRDELLAALLSDAPPPALARARPGASKELEILCRTCLAKDPRDRYASAAALAEDLRRFARGEAVIGAPLWKRARSFARRHRKQLTVAAVLALAGAMVGVAIEYQRAIKARGDGEALLWLDRVRAANVTKLPELIKLHDPNDPRVLPGLLAQFGEPDPAKKLSAAVALAVIRPECARLAYDRLLSAGAVEIEPLARALDGRLPDLGTRLERDAAALSQAATEDEVEVLDLRRANAATALILIGRTGPGFRLLTFSKEPQARSFLIHMLGPAGVPPEILFEAMKATNDDSIRRSLLQAFGEVPEARWEARGAIHAAIEAEAERLYAADPDPGVHGSAKWLLRRWGFKDQLHAIDHTLRGVVKADFGWRISKTGLTMVKVFDPDFATAIEVSDCEITVGQYQAEFPEHPQIQPLGPGPDCPVNNIDFSRSAAFCNRLSLREGIAPLEFAYEPRPNGPKMIFFPVLDRLPSGFRLPTDREFNALCRGGVRSRCYFGRSARLAPYYSLVATPRPRMTVAAYKPNDLGLFDTLGNVREWARSTAPADDPRNQAVGCGAYYGVGVEWLGSEVKTMSGMIDRTDIGLRDFGFRVVRPLVAGP
ncbi:MAG: serine/threonine protein kinase [Planctomycetota bacterium]|nr:serine/threonine protein kinase [Planctomycetota bacterium]